MGLTTNIITFSIIIILIYVIFRQLTRSDYTGSVISASTSSSIETTNTVNCAYSGWIYIDNWSSGKKIIFYRGGTPLSPNFSLNLGDTKNLLSITTTSMQNILSTYETYTLDSDHFYPSSGDYYYSSPENCENLCSSNSDCKGFNYYSNTPTTLNTVQTSTLPQNDLHGCKLINSTTSSVPLAYPVLYSKVKDNTNEFVIDNAFIPLQEWVFITINVTTFYIEVYINGKLVRTIASKDTLQVSGEMVLTPNGGFNGKTSDFKFFNTDLSATQIWNNYRAGFGKYFSLSDYSIKIKFNEEND